MSMADDSSVLFATLVVGGKKTKSQACALTTYWPMGTNSSMSYVLTAHQLH